MFYNTVSYFIHLNNVFKFVRAKSYICRLADKTLHHAVRATTVDDAIGVRKAQTLLTLGVGTDSVQRKGGTDVPNLDGAIVTGGSQNIRIGGRPLHIGNPSLVAGPERRIGNRRRFRPRLGVNSHIPQSDSTVRMGRCHHVGVVTPSQGRNDSRTIQCEDAILTFEVVYLERMIPATSNELGTVGSMRVGHATNV